MNTRTSKKRKADEHSEYDLNYKTLKKTHINGNYIPLQTFLKKNKIEIKKYGWDKVSLINQNDEEIYSDELIKFEVDITLKVARINNKGKPLYKDFSYIKYNDLIISFNNIKVILTSKKDCEALLNIIPKQTNSVKNIIDEELTDTETEEVLKETIDQPDKNKYISGSPIESDDDDDDEQSQNQHQFPYQNQQQFPYQNQQQFPYQNQQQFPYQNQQQFPYQNQQQFPYQNLQQFPYQNLQQNPQDIKDMIHTIIKDEFEKRIIPSMKQYMDLCIQELKK